jgi:phosphoribosylformimino-5-aminoimidazole carboxamide ribotide isomerase
MRVIPVLDLLHAQVVRGVAGRRSEYRPIESVLSSDTTPRSVASALSEKLGLRSAYIADLDAILNGEPNWQAYRAIAEFDLELLIDAGLQTLEQAEKLLAFFAESNSSRAGEGSLIAGLESVSSPRLLSEMLALTGPGRLIFSLDLKAGQPLTTSRDWPCESPERILDIALELGIQRFILLDLSRVGVDAGVGTEALCERLRTQAPQAEIIAGGGVRGIEDLHHLSSCGCNGALVASALHDGRLDRDELAPFRE